MIEMGAESGVDSAAGRTTADRQPCLDPPFETFYRQEYAEAVRLAAFLGAGVQAEDVVQDVFLAIRPRFAVLDAPKAYLRRSLINAVGRRGRSEVDRVRREREAARSVEAPGDPAGEMWDSLGRLPYGQRAVLVLRVWLGLTDEEIARFLGCRRATVRSRARRALAQLRKEMTDGD